MHAIRHIFHIESSFESIFKAMATVDGLKNWWTQDTTGDHRLGGVLRFGFGPNTEAVFRVVLFERTDEFSWLYEGKEDDEWFGTNIHVRLKSNEGKVLVDFSHANFKENNDFFARCNFTWANYLLSLKAYCESGKGKPFQI